MVAFKLEAPLPIGAVSRFIINRDQRREVGRNSRRAKGCAAPHCTGMQELVGEGASK